MTDLRDDPGYHEEVITDLAGRSVLITGASIGIGRETALRFAAAGCKVALTYAEHRAEAEEAAERCLGLGAPDAFATSLRLGEEGAAGRVVEEVVRRFGRLAILVNNAGVISWRPFLEQDLEDIDEQILVNLLGVMRLTWCALPVLSDAVITVGSTATLHQSRTPPPYCASKWGLRGFVKALALEHPDKRIVSVHPTVTATRMNDMRGMSAERVADVIYRVAAREIEVEPGGDVDLRDYAD
jgi:NAD(P)-dependent dehydrogenase (short-subunit alcohol dehydrogenase family)